MREAEPIMANSFLIVMPIWFAVNILFVAWRLWMTRPGSWEIDAGARHLSPVSVKSHLPPRLTLPTSRIAAETFGSRSVR
jgi:hypothetical protein